MNVGLRVQLMASRLAVAAVMLLAVGLSSSGSVNAVSGDEPTPTIPASQVRGDIGDVVLVDDTGTPLESGDGTTKFFVRLPPGASCPGDSASDQWRINSFLVPVDEDPLQLLFGSSGPEPPWTSGRYPLFNQDNGLAISLGMLRQNSSAGSPGLINQIPQTSFTMLALNNFAGGRYRLGIACTYFAQTTQYWDRQIVMTGAPNGQPNELTWTLPIAAEQTSRDGGSGSSFAPWLLIIPLAAGLAVLGRRKRRSPATLHTTKEFR